MIRKYRQERYTAMWNLLRVEMRAIKRYTCRSEFSQAPLGHSGNTDLYSISFPFKKSVSKLSEAGSQTGRLRHDNKDGSEQQG